MPTCLGHNLHSTDPWVQKTIKRITGKRPWKSIYMVILNVRSQIRGFQVGSALPGRSTLHQREVGLNIIHFRQDIDGIICYFLFDFQLFQVRLAQVSCGIVAGFPSCSTHSPSYSPFFYMDSFLEFSNLRGSHGLRQVIIHPILSLLSLWKFVKVSGICSKILLLCIIFTKTTIIIFPFGQKVLCVHTCDQTFISYQKKHCGPSLGYFYPQLMLA